jgi:cobalt-zinc-cadmium efflux system membrane fusion protein
MRWIALGILVLACQGKAPPAAAPPPKEEPHPAEAEQHEAEHEGLPKKVHLEAQVVKNAGIKTTPALLDSLPATVDLTGELASDPDRTARLTARVPGRILEVRAKEGARVKAGDVIAVLDAPELARARAAFASATARARSARLAADRLGNLEAKSLAPGQEVANARAEAAALEA